MIHVDIQAYQGWNRCVRISNGVVELVATLDVGPRILRFGFVGGQNVFKEFEETLGLTGGEEWHSYGGHRLWHAPEVEPRTYYPDNAPVCHSVDEVTGEVLLTPPEEKENGLQLSLRICMDPADPKVTVRHMIRNTGRWPVELAPWALSVMAPGGEAVLPQEPFVAHGTSFSPARPLVLWKFTAMNDPRFTWGDRYIRLREDASVQCKQKIGARSTLGWLAYGLHGDLFLKRFPHDPAATYPDMDCNCELYTEPGFLELESLGPLASLAPGQQVEHQEAWLLARAVLEADEDALGATLDPLLKQLTLG